jgi:hypothetical protein
MIATRQIEDVLSRAEPWFASRVMREATSIAVSLPVLCELVWVWQRLFGLAMAVWLGDGCLAWRWLFGLLAQRWKLAWPRRRLVETSPMG